MLGHKNRGWINTTVNIILELLSLRVATACFITDKVSAKSFAKFFGLINGTLILFFLATFAILLSSVEMIISSKILVDFIVLMTISIMGFPKKLLIFFFGILLLPPRAIITAIFFFCHFYEITLLICLAINLAFFSDNQK